MIEGLSPRAVVLLRGLRKNLELLAEHDKFDRREVDVILAAMIAHVRSFRPQVLLAAQAEEVPHG